VTSRLLKRLEGGSGRHPPCRSLTVASKLSCSVFRSEFDSNRGVKPSEYHVDAASLAMPLRRGNPNWGSGQQPRIAPAAATEFEWKLQELGLTNETCVSSVQLRSWCAQNKNRYYIPEWLLKAWQMHVDPDLSSAA
jgi:hypothetical protein